MHPHRLITILPQPETAAVHMTKMGKFRQFRDSWRFPVLLAILAVIALYLFGGDSSAIHY
jgi:hypothetical protein